MISLKAGIVIVVVLLIVAAGLSVYVNAVLPHSYTTTLSQSWTEIQRSNECIHQGQGWAVGWSGPC